MKRSFVLSISVLVALTLFNRPAYALPIVPDPLIGVLGGGGGSPDVTDGSIFALTQALCEGSGLSADFFCADYNNSTEVALFALDFSVWDATGQPIPATPENFQVAEDSDFQAIRFPNTLEEDDFTDANTVRLCALDSEAGQAACGIFIFEDPTISPGADLLFFADTPGFVSLRAVNTVPNANLPDNTAPIPEPATLALLGSGLVAAVGRARLRRRPKTSGSATR